MPENNFYQLDYRGNPAFFVPAYRNDSEALKRLLENPEQKELINREMRLMGGMSVLHAACMVAGNLESVKVLVANGANLAKEDYYNRYPLHIAANAGSVDIVKFIKEKLNADFARHVTGVDSDGRNALHALCVPGSSIQEKHGLLDSIDQCQLLETLKVLLSVYDYKQKKQLLQQEDNYGFTPLMYAWFFAQMYHEKAGDNPVQHRISNSYQEIVKYICEEFDIKLDDKLANTKLRVTLDKLGVAVQPDY